jgi:hypothetical protein
MDIRQTQTFYFQLSFDNTDTATLPITCAYPITEMLVLACIVTSGPDPNQRLGENDSEIFFITSSLTHGEPIVFLHQQLGITQSLQLPIKYRYHDCRSLAGEYNFRIENINGTPVVFDGDLLLVMSFIGCDKANLVSFVSDVEVEPFPKEHPLASTAPPAARGD